ncbi:GGDEF domain-containing protein [Pseudomonas stutzeri]|uniref:GGDEF domain-containing protein n=1 Tax=Stutzerimonas stutzeri TaxID=316 RepID=UPI00210C3F2A|nr:GGDEF domain-containing protein [Stutzerimonas stutzeri]MCQ4307578.1 GGDEF domain-containing protein [Stutzerimonas stutzeri]
MQLSVPTLIVADIYVMLLVALLMFLAWRSGRREPTLGYLCLTLFLGVVSTALGALRNMGIDWVPIVLGNSLLVLALAFNWTAMRVFAGRQPHWQGIVAAPLIWAGLCLFPAFFEADALRLRIATLSLFTIIYIGLAMAELWRSRQVIQVSLHPALVLMAVHIAVYTLRIPLDHGRPFEASGQFNFFALVIFETMLYAVGIAFVTLAMVRERAELEHRQASLSDPLTGIGNRRAFVEHGERLLLRCRDAGQQVTLLLCDLDQFKRLNDTFGHKVGDHALISFCQVMKSRMRRQDVFGRIGGEEFACLLADANAQVARDVAERIRSEFANLPFSQSGILSVSIGVSDTTRAGYSLDRLMGEADRALYEAKATGRNCVRVAI